MSDFEVSDDGRVLYDGSCKIKSYGSSSNSDPFIGVEGLEVQQFDYIMHNLTAGTTVNCYIADGDQVVWAEEMQFKSAYDSTAGKWIKLCFQYQQDLVDIARSMEGNHYTLHLIEGQVYKKPEKKKGEHGHYASQLIQSKAMISPRFWSVVGPEDWYLDWVRSQPCLITGSWVESEDGDKRCEAAHVRDIKYGAGIATKPEYFAIPLHPKIHAKQHEQGIYKMWQRAGRPTPSSMQYPIQSQEDHIRQWLKITTLEYIKKWIQFELKKYFSVESMSFISADHFESFLRDKASPEDVDGFINLSKEKRDLSFLSGENN